MESHSGTAMFVESEPMDDASDVDEVYIYVCNVCIGLIQSPSLTIVCILVFCIYYLLV